MGLRAITAGRGSASAPCQRVRWIRGRLHPASEALGLAVGARSIFLQSPKSRSTPRSETSGGRAGWAVLAIGGGGLALVGTMVLLTGALIEAAEDDLANDDGTLDGGHE